MKTIEDALNDGMQELIKNNNFEVDAQSILVNVLKKHITPFLAQTVDAAAMREAWRTVAEADSLPPRELTSAHRIWYEADQPQQPGAGKLRPSMFMPRWASRLTLEITDIRVERLQDISEADAIAEGVQCSALEKIQARHGEWAKRAYRSLWEQINGEGSWNDNSWVWVYTVKKVAQ